MTVTSIANPSSDSLTATATDNFHRVDPRSVAFERTVGAIFAGLLTVGAIVGLIVLWLMIGLDWIFWLVCGAAILILLALFVVVIFWPAVAYRHAQWRLDDDGLEIHTGVFWRHRICIPLGRVQHADVSQGPLQRPFGLGKLTVHTAGTQNSHVDLDGLAHPIALKLRDRLVQQSGSRDAT